MAKNMIKCIIIIILVVFLLLFFFGRNIYQNSLTEKRDLTEEQIQKFEDDVKNGKEIDINNYIVKEKDYSNLVTSVNNSISNIIEKGFRKIFEYLIKNVDI